MLLLARRSLVQLPRRGNWLGGSLWRRSVALSAPRSSPLQDAFDAPTARPRVDATAAATGYFGIGLLAPGSAGLKKASQEARSECERLVQKIVADGESPRNIVRLDSVSNHLCNVLDVADFIRNFDPNADVRQAAHEAWTDLAAYMETLNTQPTLYFAMHNSSKTLDKEDARLCLRSFLVDFERSGVHLPADLRERVLSLTNRMQKLAFEFNRLSALPSSSSAHDQPDEQSLAHFTRERAASLAPEVRRVLGLDRVNWDRDEQVVLPVCDTVYQYVLRFSSNSALRQEVYEAHFQQQDARVTTLEELLETRRELAQAVGFKSYAHRTLDTNSMMDSPDNVDAFLTLVAKHIHPHAQHEYDQLCALKQRREGPSAGPVAPWDYWHYLPQVKAHRFPSDYRRFLSVGTCIQGFSTILQRVFGVHLTVEPTRPGELWHPDVVKLAMRDDTPAAQDTLLGVVYCDLFSRSESGSGSPAVHHTIRCAGRLPDGSWQSPVSSLSCGFVRPKKNGVAFLTIDELETLFHEMGHAVHSLLSQGQYHNVAGTRVLVDFVEVPSMLMENFAWDPRVLCSFARDCKTGEPMSREMANEIVRRRHHFAASRTMEQVARAAVDQVFHGPESVVGRSTVLCHRTMARFLLAPPSTAAPVHVAITHLVNYGAHYYSYLWAQALSSCLWHELFENDPFCRENGERYRRLLLEHGGSKDPWAMITAVLGKRPDLEYLAKSLADRFDE